jgi:hypothetical protein
MNTRCNVGTIDRLVRVAAGAALIATGLTGLISGAIALVAGFLGIVLLSTAALRFCPIYRTLGWSTCGPEARSAT